MGSRGTKGKNRVGRPVGEFPCMPSQKTFLRMGGSRRGKHGDRKEGGREGWVGETKAGCTEKELHRVRWHERGHGEFSDRIPGRSSEKKTNKRERKKREKIKTAASPE